MPGTRGHSKPLSIDDAKGFMETYVAERGIKNAGVNHPAIKACRGRAEDARESYKKLTPVGITKPKSGAQKYVRRLHNNRKSAAATRVFQEVEDAEQKYLIVKTTKKLARAKAKEERAKNVLAMLRTEVARMTGDGGVQAEGAVGMIDVENDAPIGEDGGCASGDTDGVEDDGGADDAVLPPIAPIETTTVNLPTSAPLPLLALPPFASFGLSEDDDEEDDAADATPEETAENVVRRFSVRLDEQVPFYSTGCSQNDGNFGLGNGGNRNNEMAFGF